MTDVTTEPFYSSPLPTAAIYARVSTPGQQEDGTSLETQVAGCKRLAEQRGFHVPSELIFQEQASGADRARPILSRIQNMARKRELNALLVYSPDRLSRDPLHLMVVSEDLAALGVQVLFVEGPSGDTPEDKLVRYILGYVGEKERALIAERTTRGKRAVAAKGKMPTGTGRGLYGYNYDPASKERAILEAEATVVQKVFSLVAGGMSAYQVAQQLNQQGIPTKSGSQWHPLTIKRIVTNTSYLGIDYYGKESRRKTTQGKTVRQARPPSEWIPVEGFTPPIVDRATFDLAQRMLKGLLARPGRAIDPYLLTGFIACGECGSPMVGTRLNRRYRYYRCRATWPTSVTPARCKGRYIRAEALERAILNQVHAVLTDPSAVVTAIERRREGEDHSLDDEIARLKRMIKSCRDQERRLVTLYQFGEIDEEYIRGHTQRLREQRLGYEGELESMEEQLADLAALKDSEWRFKEMLETVDLNFESQSLPEKRRILATLGLQASVMPDSVTIRGLLQGEQPLGISSIARTWA